jgi:hypothetical protein
MTLEQLIEIWAPENAETIQQLLQQKLRKGSTNWLNWMGSTIPFWKGQRPPTPKCQIRHFDVDETQGTSFAVTTVASMACLDKLDIFEIELAASLQGSPKGGLKRLNSNHMRIRVS